MISREWDGFAACRHTSQRVLHVEGTLGLGRLLFGVVANQSGALGQAKVVGQQGAMLHADGPQGGAVDLHKSNG